MDIFIYLRGGSNFWSFFYGKGSSKAWQMVHGWVGDVEYMGKHNPAIYIQTYWFWHLASPPPFEETQGFQEMFYHIFQYELPKPIDLHTFWFLTHSWISVKYEGGFGFQSIHFIKQIIQTMRMSTMFFPSFFHVLSMGANNKLLRNDQQRKHQTKHGRLQWWNE